MKYLPFFIFASLFSCGEKCADFNTKSEVVFRVTKASFLSNKKYFDSLKNAFDQIPIDSLLKRDIKEVHFFNSETTDTLAQNSSTYYLNNAIISKLLDKLNCRRGNLSISEGLPLVRLYPYSLETYNDVRGCEGFSVDLMYTFNRKNIFGKSENFRLYQLDSSWFLRTGMSSL